MLNLPQFKQTGFTETDAGYVIQVDCIEAVPTCDCDAPHVVRNGARLSRFVDTPMHGKQVEVEVARQRYLCRSCRASLVSPIPHVDEKRMMTHRAMKYIFRNGAKRSWKALADDIGVDAQSVADIWNEWADAELAKVTPSTPDWMGIDELRIMGKFRAVITNVRARALVTMLPEREIGTLYAYFLDKFEANKIEVVTMDMWDPYRTVIKNVFPKAKIVADRFHVMMYASKAVEEVRKTIRRQLDKQRRIGLLGDRWLFLTGREKLSAFQTVRLEAVLEQYPTIKEAYLLKEAFRDVWKTTNRQEAEAIYEDWKKRAEASASAAAFFPLTRMIGNWHEEVFAYLDWRLSNGYTEGFNAMARRMDRIGNGYSFEALKKRLIMTHGFDFREKPVVNFSLVPGAPTSRRFVEKLERQLFPRHSWKVVGYRFSTMARVAAKLPDCA